MTSRAFADLAPIFGLRITPDFRNFVYCTAITHGGQDEFDFLKLELGQLLKDASDYTGSERDFMIHGLACVREPYLINQ